MLGRERNYVLVDIPDVATDSNDRVITATGHVSSGRVSQRGGEIAINPYAGGG